MNDAERELFNARTAEGERLRAALETIQATLYGADNAETEDVRTQCVRHAFGVAYAALATPAGVDRP